MAEPGGNKPLESIKNDRKRPPKTTDQYIASHQWVPKASRQQAAPGDQRGRPAAAHIGLHGNVEKPSRTGKTKPPDPKLDEKPEFRQTRDVVSAKDPSYRPRSKNKCCQTKTSPAIAPT